MMSTTHKFEPTGVICIIDAAYILKGSPGNIDYIALRRDIQEWSIQSRGGRFDQTIFFNSFVEGDEKQASFHEAMKGKGFDVRLYPLKEMNVKCSCCNITIKRQVQKGVDVGICTSILELSDKYKRLVLLAGDGDFHDAIQTVKKKFKEVYVCGFQSSMSRELREAATEIKFL